jgi:hypothetical protein
MDKQEQIATQFIEDAKFIALITLKEQVEFRKQYIEHRQKDDGVELTDDEAIHECKGLLKDMFVVACKKIPKTLEPDERRKAKVYRNRFFAEMSKILGGGDSLKV